MPGLANLGNTCFMNSAIQALNSVYDISPKHKNQNVPEYAVYTEWETLQNELRAAGSTAVVNPRAFLVSIQRYAMLKDRQLFTGYAQNDMPEFLGFLMEALHTSIARKKNLKVVGLPLNDADNLAVLCYTELKTLYEKEYSEIAENYYGVLISYIQPAEKSFVYSRKAEIYFQLDLPIPDNMANTTIYDCLNLFMKPELLDENNKWFNVKTGTYEIIRKSLKIWSFPQVLVISLKRFSNNMHKKNTLVEFPITGLNLSTYSQGYSPHRYVYNLYAVCNHYGNVMGGHYTAHVRCADGSWVHCNDSSVEPVANIADIITPSAYCLIYKRKS